MTKRYIEDVLPLGELNKYAQKGGGIGSLNAMHPYFARRPLTASRAMTLAALMDAPGTDSERKTFERLLIELSNEEWPDKPELLEKAQKLIQKAHGGRTPRVLDPFAGGGSMSLEAMRLGCEATALDLNPVAYLALIASLVYPQEFGQKTGDPDEQRGDVEKVGGEKPSTTEELPGVKTSPQSQISRLVEDVRHWAEYVMMQAETEIGDCYASADSDGTVPVSYLWAKTSICPHCGGEMPLIKRRWLQQKDGAEPTAYRLNVDKEAKTYTVEILRGESAIQSEPSRGTMRGATVECIYCGTPSERERIVEQGQSGEMGQHMLVVVLNRDGETGRDFRPADDTDREAYAKAEEKVEEAKAKGYDFWGFERLLSVVPDEPTPPSRARSVSIRLYGIAEWGQLFNERQALALLTLGRHIRSVRELLAASGEDHARAIALYLSILLNRYITRSSVSTVWDCGYNKISSIFSRHDIQMTWDYAEANPFCGQAASWESQLNAFILSLANLVTSDGSPASIRLGSAASLPDDWGCAFDAVITDPPYYDSVTYADLTDYFYPWHKRVIGDDYPEAFVTEVTPKDEELVQEAIYHGGTKPVFDIEHMVGYLT
jgi:putative DNA methylase